MKPDNVCFGSKAEVLTRRAIPNNGHWSTPAWGFAVRLGA